MILYRLFLKIFLLKISHFYHLQAFKNHSLVVFESQGFMVDQIDDRSYKT